MNDLISILLKEAICRLRNSGISDPVGDSRKLLAHALGISKKDLPWIQKEIVIYWKIFGSKAMRHGP